MSYIDGLASGLDTTSIIRQLMQVESIPKTRLQERAEIAKAGLDAYATVRSKVSSVRTAANELDSSSDWRGLTATSSNPDAVSVSAGTGAPGTPLSFTVESLAQSMQQSSSDTFAGLDAALDGRTVSITDADGTTHDFDTAGTLGELVTQINDAGIGVAASTLQVTSGEHRLILTADDTGVDKAFSVTGTGWTDPFGITRSATDAQLDVGGITVTRSTNTIDDLIEGATITLHAETTSEVTVDVERDVAGISEKVAAMVDAVNGALADIDGLTDFDPETNERSILTGDSTVRTVAQRLTSAITGAVGQSALGTPGLAGVELQRDGTITFDEEAFAAAYESDPAAVERLFVDGAETTGDLTYVRAGWRAQPGSYDVVVTDNGDGTFAATIDGESADVTVNDDGSLRVTMSSIHERLGGLTVEVAAGQTGAVGTVDYEPGAAKRLTTATNRALDAVNGQLTTAEQSRENRIRDIDRQIEAWDVRLDKREAGLRRQYTALESMLGQLQNQSQWLTSQLAGLQANTNQ